MKYDPKKALELEQAAPGLPIFLGRLASARSRESYRKEVLRFALWMRHYLPDTPLPNAGEEAMQSYFAFLQGIPASWVSSTRWPSHHDAWRPFSIQALTPASLALCRSTLKAYFSFLEERGQAGANPLARFKPVSGRAAMNTPVQRFLPEPFWFALNEWMGSMSCETDPEAASRARIIWTISLLYFTGLRISEACRLRMNDFYKDEIGAWVSIRAGKGNKSARIPATDSLCEALAAYRRSSGLVPDWPLPTDSRPALLRLSRDKSRHLTRQALHHVVKTAMAEAVTWARDRAEPEMAESFQRVSAHWLRHTLASHLIDRGVDIHAVGEMLRHEHIETTLRYVHKEAREFHKAISKKLR